MTSSKETRAPAAQAHEDAARVARIRQLNDQLRTTFLGGRVLITSGIQNLGAGCLLQIVTAVRQFADFNDSNDAYSEHDFGALSVLERQVFWKIDYYDHRYEYGSPDPSRAGLTGRVLTIMLAEEY